MAALSPVLINTSPPDDLRAPSITPPPAHNNDETPAVSSSPTLLSPSALLLRPAKRPALKAGSRAQQVPEGAFVGFASAASLWKSHHFDATEAQEDVVVQGRNVTAGQSKNKKGDGGTKAAGKLVRPRKKQKTAEQEDFDKARESAGDTSAYFVDSGHDKVAVVEVTLRANKDATAKPSVSEYAFKIPGDTENHNAPAKAKTTTEKQASAADDEERVTGEGKGTAGFTRYAFGDTGGVDEYKHPAKPAKKSRKPAAKTLGLSGNADDRDTATKPVKKARKPATKKQSKADEGMQPQQQAKPKKSRKRTAKSAEIILNSDEPEPEAVDGQLMDVGSEDKIRFERPEMPPPMDGIAASPLVSTKQFQEFVFVQEHPDSGTHPRPAALPDAGPQPPPEQSAYFTKSTESVALVHPEPITPAMPFEPAPKRRRSWTPTRNSILPPALNVPDDLPCGTTESQVGSETPIRHLSDILGGFGYKADAECQAAPEQGSAYELTTKRRRIELEDGGSRPSLLKSASELHRSAADAPSDEALPPKPKKAKKEKKKVQTITALATAAYQHAMPMRQDPETAVVSQFFAASKDVHPLPALETNAPAKQDVQPPSKEKPKKITKPRKSRAKAATAAEGTVAKAAKIAKPKTKKATAKPKPEDRRTKLLSPSRATLEHDKQAFLFGTSSQLCVDEDAGFVRDMLTVVTASEATSSQITLPSGKVEGPGLPDSWRSRSSIRVPTAPHGTRLSIEQADKELWSTSARNFSGGIYRTFPIRSVSSPKKRAVEAQHSVVVAAKAVISVEVDVVENEPKLVIQPVANNTVDLSDGHSDRIEAVTTEQVAGAVEEHHATAMATEDEEEEIEDDSWMLLRSDDSTIVPLQLGDATSTHPLSSEVDASKPTATTPIITALHQSIPRMPFATSPIRPPLGRLDENAKFLSSQLPRSMVKEVRPLTTAVAPAMAANVKPMSPPARRRGRPSKAMVSADFESADPKRRGRPPKDPSLQSRQGLSKKDKLAASQPAGPTYVSESWLDIDEISDSETPTTPSPPRRRNRANSSPPTLELSPSVDIEVEAVDVHPATVLASLKDKSGEYDLCWQSLRPVLFKEITETVKSRGAGKHGLDAEGLTWWQKILLYDPIVVEDLTAWLNEEGLRVTVAKPRSKKTKAKVKKSKAQEKDAGQVDVIMGDDEAETVQEPLQSWMVKKWCEEMSVCCYTYENGWRVGRGGGTRGKM